MSQHIQVIAKPQHKQWWQIWKRDRRLIEGRDYILNGYHISCINPKIRHKYIMKIKYNNKF